jgi:hypothetical protein
MRHATKDLHFWVRCATKIFLLASGLGERFVMERFDGCIRNWGTKIVGMFCFTSVLCGGAFSRRTQSLSFSHWCRLWID